LVTGATGTVGASVVTELLAAGEPVRAAVRRPATPAPGGAESVRFDFADPASWSAAFEGVDRLFLMRPPAISDVTTYLQPVIRLAAERGLRQVVFLSVLGVNRLLPHWRVEQDIAAAGLPYTFLRLSFFAQNLSGAYRDDIAKHHRIRLASGRGRTSFVDTRDVAAVAALALRSPVEHAGAYTLTGPAALTYHQVASLLSAELGRPIDYQPIGLLRYRRELLAAGLEEPYVNVQLAINVVAALGRAGPVTSDVERLLGRPATPLARFIAEYAAAWRP
jgi:uncharacterized protein YbjT (DUF2867 family)